MRPCIIKAMRLMLSVFVVGGILGSITFSLFMDAVRNRPVDLTVNVPAENGSNTPTGAGPTPAKMPVPVEFHGPVGQPHIIGPSANPPNY